MILDSCFIPIISTHRLKQYCCTHNVFFRCNNNNNDQTVISVGGWVISISSFVVHIERIYLLCCDITQNIIPLYMHILHV